FPPPSEWGHVTPMRAGVSGNRARGRPFTPLTLCQYGLHIGPAPDYRRVCWWANRITFQKRRYFVALPVTRTAVSFGRTTPSTPGPMTGELPWTCSTL